MFSQHWLRTRGSVCFHNHQKKKKTKKTTTQTPRCCSLHPSSVLIPEPSGPDVHYFISSVCSVARWLQGELACRALTYRVQRGEAGRSGRRGEPARSLTGSEIAFRVQIAPYRHHKANPTSRNPPAVLETCRWSLVATAERQVHRQAVTLRAAG